MDRRVRSAALGIGFALACIALAGGLALSLHRRDDVPEGMLWPDPRSVGDMRLIDEDGRPFGRERLLGKWSFIYFGYTHCPNVCPVTLGVLKTAAERLADDPAFGPAGQMVFI